MSEVRFELTKSSIETIDRITEFVSAERLYDAITQFFQKQSQIIASRISNNYLSGQRLNRRTGNLARSVTGVGLKVDGAPAIRVGIFRGPALKYAGIQEFGTRDKNPESPFDVITPKEAEALAIPVGDDVLTPTGVSRFGPRDYPGDLRFIPFRSSGVAVGALFNEEQYQVAREFGIREAMASYLLLTQVSIEPKYYLRDGFKSQLPYLIRELNTFLRDYLRGLNS